MSKYTVKLSKRTYQKRRRKELAEKGLCLDDCGRPATGDFSRCQQCRDTRAATANRAYLLKRIKEAGLTEEDYQARMAATGGNCEVHCGRKASRFNYAGTPTAKTRRLRGIVCKECDQIFKGAEEDPRKLDRAVAFFRRDDLNQVPPQFRQDYMTAMEWAERDLGFDRINTLSNPSN